MDAELRESDKVPRVCPKCGKTPDDDCGYFWKTQEEPEPQ